MKRSATAAQLAYPDQYRAARYRRVASRVGKIPIPVMQRKAIQQVALATTKRYVQRNVSKKVCNDVDTSVAVSNQGYVYNLLSDLLRGTTANDTFDGNKLIPESVMVNYQWDLTNLENETGSLSTTVRLYIVQMRCGDNVEATDAGNAYFLDNAVGQTTAPLGVWNWGNWQNWNLLYDSGPIAFTSTTGFANSLGMNMARSIKIRKQDLRSVFFNDKTTAGNPPVTKGGIFLLAISDSALAPNPILSFQSQIVFSDNI